MTILADAEPSALAPVAAPAASAAAAVDVAVAATFTAEGLEAPLAFMLDAAGLAGRIAFAPYHQLFQELLTPGSALARNAAGGGIGVVALRLEDFVRDAEAGADLAALVSRVAGELADAFRQFRQRASAPLLVFVLRASPALDRGLAAVVDAQSALLSAALEALPDTAVFGDAAVDALCPATRHDPVADKLAHIPFTDDWFAALAIVVARQVHMRKVAAHKVLVLDCDNTIWRGVVGEDGVAGIALDPGFLAVQDYAVAAQSRGVLVCLASKNAEADVMRVFDERPDMRLARGHVVAHRINWELKSANLRALARELNLGLDAFVFLDDNPVECGLMQEMLPEVVTLQLPSPEAAESLLANLWAFDKVSVTQEDQRRTEMYRQNAEREQLEASATDIGAFLASLELKIDVSAPAEGDWPRLSQLTQRTNQFNFTTRRRGEPEMRALGGSTTVQAVRVSDRFGDYGLVGLVIADETVDAIEVDTLLLSCRVLGRGVEHAMLASLGRLAQSRGKALVRLHLVRTPKNEPALAFADAVVGAYRREVEDGVAWDVPADVAAAIVHRAGEDAPEVIAARKADAAKAPKAAAPSLRGRSARYARLATELTTGPAVMQALRAATRAVRAPAAASAQPRTATERALVVLWEELLGVSGLGIDDDFFALGGTSLLAARMIAELAHRRGVALPLTTIVEAPTLRQFAQRADQGAAAAPNRLVTLRESGERRLFLVHDGDGETLLYRNLANRLPATLSVYGIQPERRPRIPLAHLSIEEMAASYVKTVRAVQPDGPYLLGGMCAGGLIAFEMARQLQADGAVVERVLMMDSATPQAERRDIENAQRSSRLREAVAAAREGRGVVGGLVAAAGVVARKVFGRVAWELRKRRLQSDDDRRLATLRQVLASGSEWPASEPSLDFRAIYNHAEHAYRPPPSAISAVLLRATAGSGNDIPYREVFADPTLGWAGVARDLVVVDVEGGHASMLQEPQAAALARAILPHVAGAAMRAAA
ncbi:MAG TPA: HAD-IIIC family phosphatase [Burkholderiaceae bacterium]